MSELYKELPKITYNSAEYKEKTLKSFNICNEKEKKINWIPLDDDAIENQDDDKLIYDIKNASSDCLFQISYCLTQERVLKANDTSFLIIGWVYYKFRKNVESNVLQRAMELFSVERFYQSFESSLYWMIQLHMNGLLDRQQLYETFESLQKSDLTFQQKEMVLERLSQYIIVYNEFINLNRWF